MRSLRERLAGSARLLGDNMDLLVDRPVGEGAPAALQTRGWEPFLLALSDPQLATIESGGSWPADTPATLSALIESARAVTAIDALPVHAPGRAPRRLETERKRQQVDAFARVVVPLASRASRVIDVGSGHGHLTRELALNLAVPVIGLERDEALAARARSLSGALFARTDVLSAGLSLSPDDCAIGLHACGELGDAMVEEAVRARASLALVGCCLQKRRAPVRLPLSGSEGVPLPRQLLGLSNLCARDDGVEATRTQNLAARERRLALHRLLSARGPLRLGAEIEGLNRRAAHDDLVTLVGRAFARRGLSRPAPSEIEEAARWAAVHYARARRLSLPRATLARVLEVFVLLDRARYLEVHGFDVTVAALFPSSVSPRNLLLVARA